MTDSQNPRAELLPSLHALVEKWRSEQHRDVTCAHLADELEALLSRAATTRAGGAIAWQRAEHSSDDWHEIPQEGYGINPRLYKYRELFAQPVAPVVPDGPYKIEPHGDVWVLYSGRSSMFHGWNLARISEPSVGILELIEKALNAFAAPAQPQSSSEQEKTHD